MYVCPSMFIFDVYFLFSEDPIAKIIATYIYHSQETCSMSDLWTVLMRENERERTMRENKRE